MHFYAFYFKPLLPNNVEYNNKVSQTKMKANMVYFLKEMYNLLYQLLRECRL